MADIQKTSNISKSFTFMHRNSLEFNILNSTDKMDPQIIADYRQLAVAVAVEVDKHSFVAVDYQA